MAKESKPLILIFLAAFLIRVVGLGSVPVGFHGDEASIGYNAYSLLKTGKDQNGNAFPLTIDQFGDFRPAGYHYLAIPFVFLFGLTETAVRLPAAIFGAASIIALFYLVITLYSSRFLAYTSAIFLAVSPWHIILSRSTSEGAVALFFVLLGMGLLVSNNVLGIIFLIVSMFFYHSVRLFAPLLLFGMVFFSRKITRGLLVVSLAAALIFILGSGFKRAGDISIMQAPGERLALRQQILEDAGVNTGITRVFHNKVTYYLDSILGNYFEHFTGAYLFLKGGMPARYAVPWTGLLYRVDVVLLAAGLVALLLAWTKSRRVIYGMPILWLLLAPIPSALTFEDIPNVQRSSMMIPAILMILAFGAQSISEFLSRRRVLLGVLGIVYGYFVLLFFHNYFRHSFTHQPWNRNAGEKDLVLYLRPYIQAGKNIVMTSQNDNNIIFYLFYLPIEPSRYQKMGSPKDTDGLEFLTMRFLYKHCPLFVEKDGEKADAEAGTIYVNRSECPRPSNALVSRDIKRPDGTTLFRVYHY